MAKKKQIDFKIIAIRPHREDNTEINRVLVPGMIYYFFNDYKILPDESIYYKETYPECLYDYRKLKVNVSAVAGKNGTGKSTIIELLLMMINNISKHFGLNDDLVFVSALQADLYVKINTYYKISVNGDTILVFGYDEKGKLLNENILNKDFTVRDMFYTIAMNYSQYAHNISDYSAGVDEDWLSGLFHKNDSYQTPLVLNPWRDKGNIDINRENGLVTSRLIANLLRDSTGSSYDFRNLTEKFRAISLKVSPNPDKIYKKEFYRKEGIDRDGREGLIKVTLPLLYKEGKIKKEIILKLINKAYNFGYEHYPDLGDETNTLAMDYLISKLISISLKYEEYRGNFIQEQDDFDYKKLPKYVVKIARDRSHIGFKFRQTLNYLRSKHIILDGKDLDLDVLSIKINEVIDLKHSHKDKLIELIPPPIFSVDIIFSDYRGVKTGATFKTLSSGEKQMIYSTSSILYHLSNLDSVATSTPKKVKYRVVQVLLEEIELYFHPEMQRRYVKFLLDSIRNLELSSIRNINICFVTHSPFILSDIPHANVMSLALKDGKAVQVNQSRKTFAANIHTLLADSFFMQDGLCGAFAIECINSTIFYLNIAKKIRLLKLKLENHVGNDNLAEEAFKEEKMRDELEELENEIVNEKRFDHELLIRNIAEPVLAQKLSEMYDEAFPQELHNERIRAEIVRLQKLLERE